MYVVGSLFVAQRRRFAAALHRTIAGALALAAGLLFFAGGARAQQQVKPYFLVIFDTSGSMNGTVAANSCGFTTTTTDMAVTTTAPRKMDTAKCALGKILSATGDADFGLMQFAQSDGCGDGSTCAPVRDAAKMRVPIQSNTSGAILSLIDKVGSSNTSNASELCAAGYTPLGGTLIAAKDYFGNSLPGFAAPTVGDIGLACRPLSVILLTDGVECCGDCDDSMSPWNVGCPTVDQMLTDASLGACPSGTNGCGNAPTCPDGDAYETAPEKAYLLQTQSMVPSAAGPVAKKIPTYVVGFGLNPPAAGNPRIEKIAIGGGTDNPAPMRRAFYAENENELALAFSQIIADAQPPQEICNNKDDDCDTLIDEGIVKFCNKPAGMPEMKLCDEPNETLCDGVDDDCDTFIDEGLRNACGQCESPPETCDGMDNDCDGDVDEDTASGEACGTDEGECMPGKLRCVAGSEQCEGEVGPQPETCNCKDDDCDGKVDEDPDMNLCPDGRCVACMCIPRCNTRQEFEPACESGRRPDIQSSGECLCITDDCDATECRTQTKMRGDELACAPDDPSVAACLCRAGMCTDRCDGVTCGDDRVCNPRTGKCVEDNCRGFGCAKGELCDPMSAECVEDECAEKECDDDEVCRAGRCERACADVQCAPAERCEAGSCRPNPCAGVRCADGNVCDPETRECVETQCIGGTICPGGQRCAPLSGECERDPCWNVRCPDDLSCVAGECIDATPRDDGGTTTGSAGGNVRLLAKGGGGCDCAVTPGVERGASTPWAALALGLLALAGLLRRRLVSRRRFAAARLRKAGAVAALAALLGLGAGGCTVSPFCVDCVDGGDRPNGGRGGNNAGTGGKAGNPSSDGSVSPGEDGSVEDGSLGDGGLPPCENKRSETCDGKDEDCDFVVDEGVEADVNDCTQQGLCKGTQKQCIGGAFSCRFPDEREDEETLCDGVDSDCDGKTDETFDGLGDACEVGIGECKVAGTQVCGDNETSLRCEVTQTVNPSEEICDGLDNDCDGSIDEPKSDPGTAASYVRDAVVQIGASLWVYKYEAARPDATATAQGVVSQRACSRGGVMPWTNLTYEEARTACMEADMQLCTVEQWLDACNGPGNNCAYSYSAPGGSTCLTTDTGYPTDRNGCNGHDVNAPVGGADNDKLAATGAYARCFVQHPANGTIAGGELYDLSGNAKEWTTGPKSPAENPLRGGSYNNLPGGLRCAFDFALSPPAAKVKNIGFRCCTTTAP